MPGAKGARLLPDAAHTPAWERGIRGVHGRPGGSLHAQAAARAAAGLRLFGGSFERALGMAERAGELQAYGALMQALAAYAQNRRNLPLAARRFEAYARSCEQMGREDLAAGAYHELGTVAQERRDFDAAEGWYRKSLEIKERQGDEHGAAITYHQLRQRGPGAARLRRGRGAGTASRWRSRRRQGDEHGAALDLPPARQGGCRSGATSTRPSAWYRKSLEIEERQGDEHGAASSYHQLGRVAQERRDFDAAEALVPQVAGDQGAPGRRARRGDHLPPARRWWPRSGATSTRPRRWYRKSLAIKETPGRRARRGEHLPPARHGGPGAARLRRGRGLVPQVAGDRRAPGQ